MLTLTLLIVDLWKTLLIGDTDEHTQMHNTQNLLGNNNSLFSPNIFWMIFCCCCLKYIENIGHSILKNARGIVELKIKQTFKSATFIPYIQTWKTLMIPFVMTVNPHLNLHHLLRIVTQLLFIGLCDFFSLLVVPVNVLFGCCSS